MSRIPFPSEVQSLSDTKILGRLAVYQRLKQPKGDAAQNMLFRWLKEERWRRAKNRTDYTAEVIARIAEADALIKKSLRRMLSDLNALAITRFDTFRAAGSRRTETLTAVLSVDATAPRPDWPKVFAPALWDAYYARPITEVSIEFHAGATRLPPLPTFEQAAYLLDSSDAPGARDNWNEHLPPALTSHLALTHAFHELYVNQTLTLQDIFAITGYEADLTIETQSEAWSQKHT